MLSTLQELATYSYASWPVRLFSALRSAVWVTVIIDNPLTWARIQGKRNGRADMEGPMYLVGAPNREIEPGKAVMASVSELKESSPFLVTVSVRDAKGEPLPNTRIEWWQATTKGEYNYSSYGLRGHFTTDQEGNVEILTVVPGAYGPVAVLRAGHIHMIIEPENKQLQALTTQLYICPGNNSDIMKRDFLNWMRSIRTSNILQAWSVPASNSGERYKDFPALPEEDLETKQRLHWWNAKLEETATGEGLRVVGGGHTTYILNERRGWFGF